MMAGLLFARAGIDTIVLEKHADFLRDFRGDTIHPSTMEALHDLGLLEAFLRLPHQKAEQLEGLVGDTTIKLADFSHLRTQAKYIAFMPQWDFLNFLSTQAQTYKNFRLMLRTEATGLIEEAGLVKGIIAQSAEEGPIEIFAGLSIAADGRHSILRQKAGFVPEEIGAPMDVLWFKLSRQANDKAETFGRMESGRILILINRGDHWQCGYVISKGSAERLKAQGINPIREAIAKLAPFLESRVDELKSIDDLKLLSVVVDRLPIWHRSGLLCIGDAAHAMSPVGGVGINLAIQDAIATANLLADRLSENQSLSDEMLASVQARRAWPTKITQALQLFVQNQVISKVLAAHKRLEPPKLLRLFNQFPYLRRLPGYLIGLGLRPERIRSPERPRPL